MKSILYLLAFVPFLAFSQQSTTKDRNSAFKSVPTRPYEDIKKSGIVIVSKSMYGLKFKNEQLSKTTKKLVKSFFKLRLNGYKDLKKYRLKIEERSNGIYIDGVIVKS